MPVERKELVSWSQFCNLLEIDPARFVGVDVNRVTRTILIVMEPDDDGTNLGVVSPALGQHHAEAQGRQEEVAKSA